MSDELIISGSSSNAVATDELYASAQQLHRLATEASALGAELAAVDGAISMSWLSAAGAPRSSALAEFDLDQARAIMVEIEVGARAIEWALETAADGYGFIEAYLASLGMGLGSELGGLVGAVAPAVLRSAPGALAALGGVALGTVLAPTGPGTAPSGPAKHPENAVLTNPLAVSLIRTVAMSSDDAIMAAAGIPRPIARLLGDGGLALAGLALTSTAVMRAGSAAGLLTETAVRPTGQRPLDTAAAPAGFTERLSRVPAPADSSDGAQVVIERYSVPNAPDRFEVYIAGTVTFSPVADAEPFDLTSNLANAAGDGAGSYASVAEAMRLAGIDSSSPVQFTGYSQGGATAARLAASGDYNAQGLATFGAPTGQISIPDRFPTVIVEHTDDLVPALGGTQENRHAVIVQRSAFADGDIPTGVAVPAHHLENYEQTARRMDAARSTQVTEAAAALKNFAAGATSMTSTAYAFARVPAGVSASGCQ